MNNKNYDDFLLAAFLLGWVCFGGIVATGIYWFLIPGLVLTLPGTVVYIKRLVCK